MARKWVVQERLLQIVSVATQDAISAMLQLRGRE